MHHPGRSDSSRGFSLVELLVVIAVVALLMALSLPVVTKAREAVQLRVCGSNQRQIGMMQAYYASDLKGWLPAPHSKHRIANIGRSAYASGSPSDPLTNDARIWYGLPSAALVSATRPNMVAVCPDADQPSSPAFGRVQPKNAGWFYWMGYLAPPSSKKAGILACPAAGNTIAETNSVKHYNSALVLNRQSTAPYFDAVTQATLYGAADCDDTISAAAGVPSTSYTFRGWWKSPSNRLEGKAQNWSSDDAVAVDYERLIFGTWAMEEAHPDSLSVLFHDGHVKPVKKKITPVIARTDATPHADHAFVVFSMRANSGATPGNGMSYSTMLNNTPNTGFAGSANNAAPNNGTLSLWNYYATGVER